MESVGEGTLYPKKYVILMSIMMGILSIVLICAVVCCFKIFAKFRFQEKTLIISISCVIVSLASQIASTLLITIYAVQMSQGIEQYV